MAGLGPTNGNSLSARTLVLNRSWVAIDTTSVLDALRPLGVTKLDMPLTPEKVWRAIHQQG